MHTAPPSLQQFRDINVVLTLASLASDCGGPSRSSTSLASGLARAGVGVDMVSLDLSATLGSPILPPEELVRSHLIPAWHSKRLRILWSPTFQHRLRACVRNSSASVIHDNGIWLPTNYAASRVAHQLGLPLIVSLRGMLEQWSLKHRALKKKIAWGLYQKRILRGAAVLHATSAAEAQSARRAGFRQPIAVIPNGADLPPLNPLPATPGQSVVFLSRIHPKKGLLDLVEAWSALRPTGWELLIAGPDENGYRQVVEGAIRKQHLEGSVRLLGPVEGTEKSQLLQKARWFVLPSYSENFGLVIAEALAAEVPVITTHGTPWEELNERQCGMWIPTGAEALTKALRSALSMPEDIRREMGIRGRQLIAEHYGWSGIALQMKSVYLWISQGGTQPDCVQTLN